MPKVITVEASLIDLVVFSACCFLLKKKCDNDHAMNCHNIINNQRPHITTRTRHIYDYITYQQQNDCDQSLKFLMKYLFISTDSNSKKSKIHRIGTWEAKSQKRRTKRKL